MKLDDLYRDIVATHYRLRSGHGLNDAFTAEAYKVNPSCGDEITVRLTRSGDVVEELSHETVGCTVSQASASIMHTLVTASTSVAQIEEITQAVRDFLRGTASEPPPAIGDMSALGATRSTSSRVRCALLPWQALAAALE